MREDELGDALPEPAPGSGKSILYFLIEKGTTGHGAVKGEKGRQTYAFRESIRRGQEPPMNSCPL